MAGERRIVAALFILIATADIITIVSSECAYFTQFPQLDRPDGPDEDFTGVPWSQRPLLPPPRRDDVCMDIFVSNTQIIHIEEEIIDPVIIARLNYNNDSPTPYIGVFFNGRRIQLNPVIRRIPELDNGWYLVINERQDYETADNRLYTFQVVVEEESVIPLVSLSIVNIDDNSPVIHVFDTCEVAELGEARPTDCVYDVTDADGYISTRYMSFSIDSDRRDEEIFDIQSDYVENDLFRLTMTIMLKTPLNFVESAIHIFSVTASDSLPNNHTVPLMVEVENVEHRPPRWVEIFAVQQFDEKTTQRFSLRAIDGDTGINKAIMYRLNGTEDYPFFSIETLDEGSGGGILYVDKIDRDELQKEVFQFGIIAYKYDSPDNPDFMDEATVVIIVDDVNDNIPKPLHEVYTVTIPEETPLTINFDTEFGFHDIDLGINAQYNVRLEDIYPPGAAAAFHVAPDLGYQRQTFVMSTVNHRLLDYEVAEFQHIQLRFVAEEVAEPDHVGEAIINIYLENWNDEQPIFEFPYYETSFDEIEGAGYTVATVFATDRDIGDNVVHTLMGNAGNYLTINEHTGEITVSRDDAFDYHRQNELFVQVRADDTLMEPYHTTTTQLHIRLNDINNTPPTLRLPRGSPQVEENVEAGYLITDYILGTDPDTTADLEFVIDWELSYATKQGRDTDDADFHYCMNITEDFPDEDRRGSAVGTIVVNEIAEGITIDYEKFEMLYLTVRVTDTKTLFGEESDEQTYTIRIIDMNDNPPIWVPGTLDGPFMVREVSATDVIIGSVLATDIDGPLYNQVRYTIRPRDDTPDGLVKIDFYTGQISVDRHGAIDADEPRYHLHYVVVASDCCYADDPADCPPDTTCHNTEGEISIEIIDTNNKVPAADRDKYDAVVYIYENSTTGDEVQQIVAVDLDRDEIYHTLTYHINFAVNVRLRSFFAMDPDTGMVYVEYLTDEVLDRDGDEPTHQIFFIITDNFLLQGDGNRNVADTEIYITVVLLDVNDNAPELPPPSALWWNILEDLPEGIRLQPDIYAPDIDEPDTDNSRVSYGIISLEVTNRDIEVPELFSMIDINNVTGELETAMDLRSYWGSYSIHISACDYGIPQQCSSETYDLTIRPYNFHAPRFVFPMEGTVVRVARERAGINSPLELTNGELLERIAVIDEDGLEAGIVTLDVFGDEESQQYFNVVNDGENLGTLVLTQFVLDDTKEFEVTIRATDGGTEPTSLSTQATLRVIVVPTLGDPVFNVPSATVAIFELDQGLEELHELPFAVDSKNYYCEDDCHDIYYHIIDGNAAGHFAVRPATNMLYVVTELDRTEATSHTLTIVATNSAQPPTGVSAPASTLTVFVNVREADPRPQFARSLYTAGVSVVDSIGKDLLTVHADHTEGSAITYSIDEDSMTVDPSLEAVQNAAFVLNAITGQLLLNIQPTTSMQGIFEFNVVATDTDDKTDTAEVKIYVVSTLNRIVFLFVNPLTLIEANVDFIEATFSTGFDMTCNIDQIVPGNDANGVARDDITEVRAHFIQDDMPVSADDIEQLRSDTNLLRAIQTTLSTEMLNLQDFVTDATPDPGMDTQRVMLYVLGALSAVLLLLCLVLFVAYCVRTRSLNRRLEALSTTKFGSMDSGLNRVGVAVPGTNKHALEGSNPMWNERINAPNFDALSEDSGDSDLIGIEDMPQFSQSYAAQPGDVSFAGSSRQQTNAVADHSNRFGYN